MMMAGHSRHCATCGIASKVGEWVYFYTNDREHAAARKCPMDCGCAFLDEVEFECDETRVLPRVGGMA